MAIYLTLPQQVQKNKNDIKELKESDIVLHNYIPKIDKGIPLGVATLDENGLVPAEQLPANTGNYLPLSGGSMAGTLNMDGNIITDAAYIDVLDLTAKRIFSGSGFQDVIFLSNISLNSEHKIIDAVKGTNVTDMATVENINDHDDSPFSHPDIRNEILSLKGAWILRGIVEFTTTNVTQTRLNDRIQALMSRSATLGDVLVDLDSHEWYFNGTNWDDFGQANIGLATASSDGLMTSTQFTQLNGLPTVLESKLDKNNAITGDTKSKITYDEKGLVTGGSDLEATDIPLLSISKIATLQATLDGKQDTLNNVITADTKSKITYNEKGLVTGGSDLEATDIPLLSISKIATLQATLDSKQDTLVSGTNIKTVGGVSILGSGDIPVNNEINELVVETLYGNTLLLSLSDANKLIRFASSSEADDVVIIPENASVPFSIGTIITFTTVRANKKVIFTTVEGSNVLMYSMGGITGVVELNTQYGMVSIIKTATNTWQLVGALE